MKKSSGICPKCGCELHAKHICPKILLQRRARADSEAPSATPPPAAKKRKVASDRDRIEEGFRYIKEAHD